MAKGNSSEREYIMAALGGEQEGYKKLAGLYYDMIYSYIASATGDTEDSKDICQETFDKAFKALPSYDPEYAFSTWLYSIAHNCIIDYSRKKRLPATGIQPEKDGFADTASALKTEDSPEIKMISRQKFERLLGEIENLGDLYRDVARLRFIEDYAYEEISAQLGLPMNTVRTRIRRARLMLKEKLETE